METPAETLISSCSFNKEDTVNTSVKNVESPKIVPNSSDLNLTSEDFEIPATEQFGDELEDADKSFNSPANYENYDDFEIPATQQFDEERGEDNLCETVDSSCIEENQQFEVSTNDTAPLNVNSSNVDKTETRELVEDDKQIPTESFLTVKSPKTVSTPGQSDQSLNVFGFCNQTEIYNEKTSLLPQDSALFSDTEFSHIEINPELMAMTDAEG